MINFLGKRRFNWVDLVGVAATTATPGLWQSIGVSVCFVAASILCEIFAKE